MLGLRGFSINDSVCTIKLSRGAVMKIHSNKNFELTTSRFLMVVEDGIYNTVFDGKRIATEECLSWCLYSSSFYFMLESMKRNIISDDFKSDMKKLIGETDFIYRVIFAIYHIHDNGGKL